MQYLEERRAVDSGRRRVDSMKEKLPIILYVLTLVIVVVGVDVLFLRHNVIARLLVNIGIVVVFAVSYMLLVRP